MFYCLFVFSGLFPFLGDNHLIFAFSAMGFSPSLATSSLQKLRRIPAGFEYFSGRSRRSSIKFFAHHGFPHLVVGFPITLTPCPPPQSLDSPLVTSGLLPLSVGVTEDCFYSTVQRRRRASETDLGQPSISSWAWPINTEVESCAGPVSYSPWPIQRFIASTTWMLEVLVRGLTFDGPLSYTYWFINRSSGFPPTYARSRSVSYFKLTLSCYLRFRHKTLSGRGLFSLFVVPWIQEKVDQYWRVSDLRFWAFLIFSSAFLSDLVGLLQPSFSFGEKISVLMEQLWVSSPVSCCSKVSMYRHCARRSSLSLSVAGIFLAGTGILSEESQHPYLQSPGTELGLLVLPFSSLRGEIIFTTLLCFRENRPTNFLQNGEYFQTVSCLDGYTSFVNLPDVFVEVSLTHQELVCGSLLFSLCLRVILGLSIYHGTFIVSLFVLISLYPTVWLMFVLFISLWD